MKMVIKEQKGKEEKTTVIEGNEVTQVTKRVKTEYDIRYEKEKLVQIKFALNRETDSEVIEWIKKMPRNNLGKEGVCCKKEGFK